MKYHYLAHYKDSLWEDETEEKRQEAPPNRQEARSVDGFLLLEVPSLMDSISGPPPPPLLLSVQHCHGELDIG